MFTEVILATHNPAKIDELKAMLAPYQVKVLSAADFDLEEPEETGRTFQDNALIKAKYVAVKTGKPALADDSGIGFEALDGFPGVDTAPYRQEFETMEDCFQDLKKRMDVSGNYHAFIHSSLCLCFPDGTYYMFDGILPGKFVYPVRGQSTEGYHFDIVFQPDGYDQTYAELGPELKQKISHRSIACQKFIRTCFA